MYCIWVNLWSFGGPLFDFRSELKVGDEILDSLAPFIVFRGQNLTVCVALQ